MMSASVSRFRRKAFVSGGAAGLQTQLVRSARARSVRLRLPSAMRLGGQLHRYRSGGYSCGGVGFSARSLLLLTLALHCLLAWLYANQARAAINKPWQLIKRDGARGRGGVITTPPRGGFQFTVAAAGNRNAMRRLRSGRAVLTRPRRTRPADAVEFVISHVVVPLWRDSVSRSASE